MKLQIALFFILVVHVLCIAIVYITQAQLLIVTSNSMKPEFEVGDILIAVRQDSYRLDDIVSFKIGDSIATHRVAQIHTVPISDTQTEQYFQTKGDANTVADSLFLVQEQIIGKVAVVVPKVGYLVFFARSKYVLLVAIVVVIMGMARVTLLKVRNYVYKSY